uniref:Leucine-rich repeat-containing protein 45 n=1 Tax=Ciona savignyi TaxID=51511 RepID=H2Y929_CIOSA
MDEVASLFVRISKEHGIVPQDSILSRLRELSHSGSGVLDLSNHTLTIETCAVLAKILSHDLAITNLLMADCMLDEEGAKILLSGLTENMVVKVLDLRGNNFRQVGAIALGNFLKRNQTLEALFLEWNSLGIWESAFLAFCEGLASNHSLQHLDIRNNKIDPTGGKELGLMLRNNSSIHTLDLRWNNLGLVGGRALVEALRHNTSIVKIDATGNDIPRDILTCLETEAYHNEDKVRLSTNNYIKTKTLSKEIDILKSENKEQLIGFLNEIERKSMQMNATCDSNKRTINNLQETLDERKAALNGLRAKLDMCETSLQLSDEKVKDQSLLLDISRKENVEIARKYENQIKQERESWTQLEEKLQSELEETRSSMIDFRSKLSDVERKNQIQRDQIGQLKEQVAQLKSEHSITMLESDARFEKERKSWAEETKLLKSSHTMELAEVRSRMEEARRADDARVKKMQSIHDAMSSEISINAKLAQERSDHDDHMRSQRSKLKEEEQVKLNQLEERIRGLSSEKSQTMKQASHLTAQLEESNATNSALKIELDGVRRVLNNVQRQLANKDADTEEKVAHVRTELNKRIEQLVQDSVQCGVLREKVACLSTRLEEQGAAHKDNVHEKDKTIEQLREQLRNLRADMDRSREDEIMRANSLQTAILSYVQGVKKSASTASL